MIPAIKRRTAVFLLAAFFSLTAFAENTALIPTPHDFPTNWISRHEANVAEAQKGGVDLLFLGDSITDGWRWDTGGRKIWAEDFAPRHAANFGIGWDRIQNVLWRGFHRRVAETRRDFKLQASNLQAPENRLSRIAA